MPPFASPPASRRPAFGLAPQCRSHGPGVTLFRGQNCVALCEKRQLATNARRLGQERRHLLPPACQLALAACRLVPCRSARADAGDRRSERVGAFVRRTPVGNVVTWSAISLRCNGTTIGERPPPKRMPRASEPPARSRNTVRQVKPTANRIIELGSSHIPTARRRFLLGE